MGTAIYIVPEQPVAGVEEFVNGDAVAAVDEVELDELCKQLKVKSLWDFVSQDADDFTDLLEASDLEIDNALLDEAWFKPEDGLKTVRALQGHLVTDPRALSNSTALIEDLQEYEWVLTALAEQNVRWHFAVGA